jgi:hypothetical protein
VTWQSNGEWDKDTVEHDSKYLAKLLILIRDQSYNQGVNDSANIFKEPLERLTKRLTGFNPKDHHPDQPVYERMKAFQDSILALRKTSIPPARIEAS